jgi:hypothetical protein
MTDAIGIIPAPWYFQILTKANWAQFEQNILKAAHERLLNEFEYGFIGFIQAPADWAAMPGNVDGNGVVARQPVVPAIPADPAPPDGTAGDDRRYDREMAAVLRTRATREKIIAVRLKFKELLLNPAVVGKHHAVATGAGDTLAQINDTPKEIFARLKTHLGTPDADTFLEWSKVYRTPAQHVDVSEWMRQDTKAHTQLSQHGQQLSEAQRLAAFRQCYKLSPAVNTCWTDYCKATPVLAAQNFTDFLAYVLLQEPNIREALTKTDIGIPSSFAAITKEKETCPGEEKAEANVATTPAAYSQDQLDRAVREAVAIALKPYKDKYCWLHGFQRSHTGLECRSIVAGGHIRAKRDSRAPLAATMVFDRAGGITAEQAQEAVDPLTWPRYPGNALKPGGKPHA